jgi:hypothetical protein
MSTDGLAEGDLYWLLDTSGSKNAMINRRKMIFEHVNLAFSVCLSRWASWGSSDARRFRQSAFSPLPSRLCQEIADPMVRIRTPSNP